MKVPCIEHRTILPALLFTPILLAMSGWASAAFPGIVATDAGRVEGTVSADGAVRVFKGIPFAAPPVGELRWKAPQPVTPWEGIRSAYAFGPRCMQARVYDDMVFRDNGPSEDCLYLNVWSPASSPHDSLPVMVWIYGGGFAAGGSSECRQDGEVLAKRGVVVVSLNYRLGVFGFFSHPELARESPQRASGNYGLLDQVAALQWVQKNIAAFGGDPGNVTIFGESAGSISVCALVASPMAKGLFQKAIGESGALFRPTHSPPPLALAEAKDQRFADSLGAHSLAALRALPAGELLHSADKTERFGFWPIVDGYFLPDYPRAIFDRGQQSHVPLLAGWTADEGNYQDFFGAAAPTAANFAARAHELFGQDDRTFLQLYPAATDEEARRSAHDYAGDQFIVFSTWQWLELQRQTGGSPVYRYQFDQALPPAKAGDPSPGAYHSAEIEFVFEVLASKALPWRPEDQRVSELMAAYWTNFAKAGDPNGNGLPRWPIYARQTGDPVMHLSAHPAFQPDPNRARYEFLDARSH